jgi:hypothetical protein
MRSLPDKMWMTTLIMSPGCLMARDEAVPVWQTRSFAPWNSCRRYAVYGARSLPVPGDADRGARSGKPSAATYL